MSKHKPFESDKVEVPKEFQDIGYSGLFWQEAQAEGGPEALARWRDKAPCLLPTSGWMLLSVDAEAEMVIVVRQDMEAVADLIRLPVQDAISRNKRPG